MARTGKKHVVRKGETLARIAAGYGYTDFHALWNAPENEVLRTKRKNPNVLLPGDVVSIPDAAVLAFDTQTGRRLRFVVKRPPLTLRLRVLDVFGQPVANENFFAVIGKREETGSTDGDGHLSFPVRPEDTNVTLTIGTMTYTLSVGELDPVRSPTGAAARLHNLGLAPFAVEDAEARNRIVKFGLMLFADQGDLKDEGDDYEAVAKKLEEVHGT